MKRILLHLPLVAGLLCCAGTLTAKDEQLKTDQTKPLHFIANAGQVIDQYFHSRGDIDFKLAAGNGLNIFIGAGKIEYQWAVPKEIASVHVAEWNGAGNGVVVEVEEEATEGYKMYRMDVRLIGANPHPHILREGQQAYYERYFLPWVNKDNSNDGIVANAYSKITYKEVYPHIDWVFYFNAQGQLEHDFIVHPGGKVSDIRMRYSGADQLQIHPDGSLVAVTPMGSLKEHAPIAYSNQKTNIPARFRLQDDHIISFDIAPYTGTLVIDPVLEWGTYYGGAGNDECFAITTDKWGFVYMAGSTASTDNIATTGAHQTTFGGGSDDAFLSKWDKSGHLLWASYYGGSTIDVAKGLSCDTSGNVYLGGQTNSVAGIATANGFQTALNGTVNDAFLIKVDSSGQRKWGTYFGGTNNDAQTSFALTTDQANDIYITANTISSNLPTTSGVHKTTLSGGTDVFVAKFNSEGSLLWSTLYGGTAVDEVYGMGVDSIFNVYVTGRSTSTTGIATAGTHQLSSGGGFDAYVSKFNSLGQQVWGTYIGGSGADEGKSIVVSGDRISIAGFTGSATAISTTNAYQATIGGGSSDGFVAQLNANGTLVWSTYYGGSDVDGVFSITANDDGDLYIAGRTSSVLNVVTPGAIQEIHGGSSDCFVAKLNHQGKVAWSSYYGGSGSDFANAVGLTGDQRIYIGGRTNSGANIATSNGRQSALGGGRDAFLVQINDCDAPLMAATVSGDSLACAGTPHWYQSESDNLAHTYHWLLPDTWLGNSDSSSIEIILGDQDGSIRVYAQSACGGISDTAFLQVTVVPLPEPKLRNNNGILSTTQVYESYQWMRDGETIEGATAGTYLVDKNGRYSLRVSNTEGCEGISDTMLMEGVGIRKQWPQSGISVYPNPATTSFTLQAAASGVLELWNIEGCQVLHTVPVYTGRNQIDVRHLPAGMYLLRLTTTKGCFYGKLTRL